MGVWNFSAPKNRRKPTVIVLCSWAWLTRHYKVVLTTPLRPNGQFASNSALTRWVHEITQLNILWSVTCWLCRRNVFRWMHDKPGQLDLSTQHDGGAVSERKRIWAAPFLLSQSVTLQFEWLPAAAPRCRPQHCHKRLSQVKPFITFLHWFSEFWEFCSNIGPVYRFFGSKLVISFLIICLLFFPFQVFFF